MKGDPNVSCRLDSRASGLWAQPPRKRQMAFHVVCLWESNKTGHSTPLHHSVHEENDRFLTSKNEVTIPFAFLNVRIPSSKNM